MVENAWDQLLLHVTRHSNKHKQGIAAYQSFIPHHFAHRKGEPDKNSSIPVSTPSSSSSRQDARRMPRHEKIVDNIRRFSTINWALQLMKASVNLLLLRTGWQGQASLHRSWGIFETAESTLGSFSLCFLNWKEGEENALWIKPSSEVQSAAEPCMNVTTQPWQVSEQK